MSQRIKTLIIAILLSLFAFVSFASLIYKNDIVFVTDEIYWIQTGRTLPHILEGKFKDIYWREHPGFTNFNGAKWAYAFGLRTFGHTDFSLINYSPTHLDQFTYTDSKTFPINDPFYTLIQHGRFISAFFVSLCIGLMFLLAWQILRHNYIAASVAAILLMTHPTIFYIATHALADSMLLFSQLLSFILTVYALKSRLALSLRFYIALGIVLGYGVAVKINGLMFYIVYFIVTLLWSYLKNISKQQFLRSFAVVTISALLFFLIIHPNFYFFPAYTPAQMIQDRIAVTKYHITYFANIDPGHVLFTIPQRLSAMNRHIFTPILRILFVFGVITNVYYFFFQKKKNPQTLLIAVQWLNSIIMFEFLLMYAVFNDLRYFLPMVPFVCIIASSWIPPITHYISSLGRYWRASAT